MSEAPQRDVPPAALAAMERHLHEHIRRIASVLGDRNIPLPPLPALTMARASDSDAGWSPFSEAYEGLRYRTEWNGHQIMRIAELVPAQQNAYGSDREATRLPVPGMYGGFRYWFEGDGLQARLMVESGSRICGGSFQLHEITPDGVRLVADRIDLPD